MFRREELGRVPAIGRVKYTWALEVDDDYARLQIETGTARWLLSRQHISVDLVPPEGQIRVRRFLLGTSTIICGEAAPQIAYLRIDGAQGLHDKSIPTTPAQVRGEQLRVYALAVAANLRPIGLSFVGHDRGVSDSHQYVLNPHPGAPVAGVSIGLDKTVDL